jgi:hypothetical protein
VPDRRVNFAMALKLRSPRADQRVRLARPSSADPRPEPRLSSWFVADAWGGDHWRPRPLIQDAPDQFLRQLDHRGHVVKLKLLPPSVRSPAAARARLAFSAVRTAERALMKPYRGPPATLGSTAAAHVQIIVWCRARQHQVEPELKIAAILASVLDCRDLAGPFLRCRRTCIDMLHVSFWGSWAFVALRLCLADSFPPWFPTRPHLVATDVPEAPGRRSGGLCRP